MKQIDYLAAFRELAAEKIELTERKNSDYAGPTDAFANFRLIESLTQGKITVEQGILVRMSDKLQRITNLLSQEAQVKDESINDTLQDLSIYADILNIYIRHKR